MPMILPKVFARCPCDCLKKRAKTDDENNENDISDSTSAETSLLSEEIGPPKSKCQRLFALRNVIGGFSVFDFVLSILSGSYLLGSYLHTRFAIRPETLEHYDNHLELYSSGAAFCGVVVIISILLFIGVIKFVSLLLWLWMLLSFTVFALILLAYYMVYAAFNLLPIAWTSIALLVGGLYKFVESLLVYRWTQELKFRRRVVPSEIPSPSPEGSPGNLAEGSPSQSPNSDPSSSSTGAQILISPPHNPRYYEFMGFGPSAADGGLFDFGRPQPRFRDEDNVSVDSAL